MSFVNSVTLIGNVGSDPEIRLTQTGKKLCRLSLATTERYTKGGEPQEKTLWHSITLWEKTAEIAEQHLRKGFKVYVEGRLNYNEWVDDNQTKRKSVDIVANRFIILTPKSNRVESDEMAHSPNNTSPSSPEDSSLSAYPF